MNNQPKAVVIGAGVGGLATANYLAQNGYAVEIYEKNCKPGGRCGQLIQDGHRFDLGATILLMPSLYKQVLSELGVDLEKDLETTLLEPVYKLFFSDDSDFAFTPRCRKNESTTGIHRAWQFPEISGIRKGRLRVF